MLIALDPNNGATEGESIAQKSGQYSRRVAGTTTRLFSVSRLSPSTLCRFRIVPTINGHILRRNCLLKHNTEGKIEGRMKVTAR